MDDSCKISLSAQGIELQFVARQRFLSMINWRMGATDDLFKSYNSKITAFIRFNSAFVDIPVFIPEALASWLFVGLGFTVSVLKGLCVLCLDIISNFYLFSIKKINRFPNNPRFSVFY
jgi:hypothetical protein